MALARVAPPLLQRRQHGAELGAADRKGPVLALDLKWAQESHLHQPDATGWATERVLGRHEAVRSANGQPGVSG